MDQHLRITVPKPCHEDWNKMSPQQQGNFCKSCNKLVYDFSKLSDGELMDFLSKRKEEKICGRFNPSQLAPPEKLSVPIDMLPKGMNSFRAFALSLFLVFGTKLFFCTTASGASVNEVKLDVRKELGAAKLEISPGNVKYLVGGWSPVGDPVGWGTTIPVLSSEILFPPNPGFDFSKLNTDSLFGKTTKFSTWDPGDSEARVTVNPGSRPYSYTWDFPRDTTQNVTPLTTTGYVVQLVTTDSMVDGQVKILEEKNENDSMPLNVIFNDLPAGDSLQWTWGEFEVNDPDSMMSTIRPSCLLIPPLAQDSIPVSHVETTPANDTTHALSSGDSSLKKMPPGDPGLFELECYPNPSHGPLNIRYTLRTTSDLNIEIYNLEGKMMKHIANDAGLVSGIYLINEDLTSLDDGIYFCRMRCGNDVITQKIILTK